MADRVTWDKAEVEAKIEDDLGIPDREPDTATGARCLPAWSLDAGSPTAFRRLRLTCHPATTFFNYLAVAGYPLGCQRIKNHSGTEERGKGRIGIPIDSSSYLGGRLFSIYEMRDRSLSL